MLEKAIAGTDLLLVGIAARARTGPVQSVGRQAQSV